MSDFAARLNQALDKAGFPPKNCGRIQLLAELVHLSHRGASKWVNGEAKPSEKKYASLAEKLEVNRTWLQTGEGPMSNQTCAYSPAESEEWQDVAVFQLADFLSPQKVPQKIMPCCLPHRGDCFGIILATESMSPRFPRGTLAIFERHVPLKDGDFVLVDYEGYPEPIFRQLLITSSSCYLLAHNPKFDRLQLDNLYRVLGKVLQTTTSFD